VPDMILWLPADGTPVDVFDHTLAFPSANYASGLTGQAFAFDGGNEVLIDDAPDLNLNKFTIEAWIYPTSLDGSVDIICNKESGGSLADIQYEIGIKGPIHDAPSTIPPGNLAFHLGGITQLTPDYLEWVDMRAQAPLNVWTHVALSVDPNSVIAYVNGRRTRSIILSPPENVRVTSGPLRLGSRSPAHTNGQPQERFNGKIDELALFSRALTPEEVTRIVQAGARGKCSRNIRTAFRGDRIASVARPYSQQVQVFVEGSGADNVQVTTTLPPGTTVLSIQPSLGTVTPTGNQLVWTLGNVLGTTNHTLNLQLEASEDGFHQLRSDVSYTRENGDNTGDDTAIVDLLVTLADDCAEVPGVVARWRAENNMLDSVGNHHGQLLNTNIFSSYFTNGPTCRAVYFKGNGAGGAALVEPAPDLEFKDGDDFTIESWIRVNTGALALTGNMVLLDRRSPPTDKYRTNPDGSIVRHANGEPVIEGELSIGYLFSLFRQGNEQNGRWILECQINSRERYFAGLVNTNLHADLNFSPTLEDPKLPQQRWNHVAVSVKRGDPTGGAFYVNGRRVGTFDPTPFEGDLTPTNYVPVRLGLHARDGYFRYQYQGAMDNMAIYRRALTDADIAKVYQSGVEGACCRNLGVSIANPPLVSVQSPFDARIRVARTGGRPPRSIVVTNEIPPGLTLLSAIPQIGTVTNIGQQVIWTVGDLDRTGDESVSLRLRLITAETNTFQLTAVAGYSGGPDDEPMDDHAESTVQSSGAVICRVLDGMLGWWTGNSSPQDIAGTNQGTITGTVDYEAGIVRGGFTLDGVSSAVKVGNPLSFHIQDLTLEAWIRRGSSTRATAAGSGGFLFAGDTGGYGFGLLDDGRLMLEQIGLSYVASSQAITNTTDWHHVAVTKSGTEVVFYIDGAAVSRTNFSARFIFNRPFALGALGGTTRNVFLGAVDELSLYNRPLTAAEIQGIFDANDAGKCREGLNDDQNTESPTDFFIKYEVEEFTKDGLIFLTKPDGELQLESSTNLLHWIPLRRIANPAGEIRSLINPTNSMLFYRIQKKKP